ncbi:activating signal cointegrator 1 complex subunit 3 [Mycoemilia scoparia]|uniref:Activating signal cointegrator 1 complex subunit 3 n=1 Tax=Mycoemilia scoparia TaxID=417184 RepID=A0A9W8A037_9FUNG|nr:activating signal cointegrator 1 complex subunit 3 [Mycoemilia scoparia]
MTFVTFTDLLRYQDPKHQALIRNLETQVETLPTSSTTIKDASNALASGSKGKVKGKGKEKAQDGDGHFINNNQKLENVLANVSDSVCRERAIFNRYFSVLSIKEPGKSSFIGLEKSKSDDKDGSLSTISTEGTVVGDDPNTLFQPNGFSSSLFIPPSFLQSSTTIEKYLEETAPSAALSAHRQNATQGGSDNEYGYPWLINLCNKICSSHMKPEDLCIAIIDILSKAEIKNSNDDAASTQDELLQLVGYDNLDSLSDIILHSKDIIDSIDSQVNFNKMPKHKRLYGETAYIKDSKEPSANQQNKKSAKSKRQQQQGGSDVVERSEGQKFVDQRKELIKNHIQQLSRNISTSDPSVLKPRQQEAQRYPNVYTATDPNHNFLSGYGSSFALPLGSYREEFKDCEEITVPASKAAAIAHTEKLVYLKEMDPLCRYTFRKYKSLNRIQSIIYPTAYGTSENILLSAPTGAGKTDVALLTILRTLSMYCTPNPQDETISELLNWDPDSEDYDGKPPKFHIDKTDFKIVYVAPMKALATEVVRKYSTRLSWLGIKVSELTGDMQLTKSEIQKTQIIVTTPEKWDVVTRKSVGDTELSNKVRLIIVDEVHLLHDDRGSVIESIIARTQRQVESSQSMIRIVGLSATLPNYVDVSEFLGVNPHKGLFYFDGGYRPVPLEQHFVGVHGKPNSQISNNALNRNCYDRVSRLVEEGHQVMVFVHARKETVRTAQYIKTMAMQEGLLLDTMDPKNHPQYELMNIEVQKSRNKELKELFPYGLAMHNAGMLRSDRLLVEKLFDKGLVKVLCCTATLAWGVNLPAYAVVIKGTQVYDSQKGAFVDLSILDVLQIFGRAGRPQYESQGVGYITTTHDKLQHYVSAITMQSPIESRFSQNMVDNLNAEVTLGTVTNVDEGVAWLSYTYLYVRMRKNPLIYGLGYEQLADDPLLGERRRELIIGAARQLAQLQMITFDERSGQLATKDLGRIASWFYLRHDSVRIFNETMRPLMTEADSLAMISLSKEFDNIRVRENEEKELKSLLGNSCCCDVKGGIDNVHGKTNVLLQAMISRSLVEDFALISDSNYVHQNSGRISRALFEIALHRGWGPVTAVLLSLCKCIERRMWPFENPLLQFELPADIARKLRSRSKMTIENLRDMTPQELGELINNRRYGPILASHVRQFPMVNLDAQAAPITRTVLKITLTIEADFEWSDKIHGMAEGFWIWVEDANNTEIYHWENIVVQKKRSHEPIITSFTIPIHEPIPAQIFIRAVSDRWLGSETVTAVSFQHLMLPQHQEIHTDLLDLQPLPVSALNDPVLEEICQKRFSHFNPVQTQIFHTLYHTSHNALIGAPTGSGKTIAAELAMWHAFREHPNSKVVYIAPLKALVKERVHDWGKRLTGSMNRSLVELTGDVTPDLESIRGADIIVTTPEKWDGVSRQWKSRDYVRSVSLVIIDEIHLLGGDRGPILEIIVSRMNFISAHTQHPVRIVGLSTALANARDLADWLGIRSVGLYNFRHSVRPVPLEMYINGFPGKHYCPRMATMNKPAYRAIKSHSPNKPVIIFVSSRRQTRLTAQDLIAYCGMEDNPRHFLGVSENELELIVANVKDANLRSSLGFGIGLHHAGLTEADRKLVEDLFANRKIQVLVATSTLAWGVNLPAHLVILKGTEFYDAKQKGYVDFPITDVLQMVGRAGRPQFDDKAVARIFVQDTKKEFYKRFLHEPFPVESSLHNYLTDHLNAEISAGSITSAQDAMDYLSWTYLYRRLRMNPTYYGLEDDTNTSVDIYLSKMIINCFRELEKSSCISISTVAPKDQFNSTIGQSNSNIIVEPTALGKITSKYYLSHLTIRTFRTRLDKITMRLYQGLATKNSENQKERRKPQDILFGQLLRLQCDAAEWSEIPVRHNEDIINRELEHEVRYKVFSQPEGGEIMGANYSHDSPHAKTMILLQKHFDRGALPSTDYVTDTRTVLDSSIRVLQAMVDTSVFNGDITTTLSVMRLLQCVKQATWPSQSPIYQIPDLEVDQLQKLSAALDKKQRNGKRLHSLTGLMSLSDDDLFKWVSNSLPGAISNYKLSQICGAIRAFPIIDVEIKFKGKVIYGTKKSSSYEGNANKNNDSTTAQIEPIAIQSQKSYKFVVTLQRRNPQEFDTKKNKPSGRSTAQGSSKNTRFPKPEMLVEQGQAFTPRFGKVQYEGWWIVLGNSSNEAEASVLTQNVLAVKRVSMQGQKQEAPQQQPNQQKALPKTLDPSKRTCSVHFIGPDTSALTNHQESTSTSTVLDLHIISDAYLGLDQKISIPIKIGE